MIKSNLFILFIIYIGNITKIKSEDCQFLPPRNMVGVEVYIADIYDLNFSGNSFKTTIWLAAKKKKNLLKGKNLNKSTEIVNANSINISNETIEIINCNSKEYYWTNKKLEATIKKNWDVKDFPFEYNKLEIQIEDALLDFNLLSYCTLKNNSILDSKIKLKGWSIDSSSIKCLINEYPTTFGDPRLNSTSKFSQVNLTIYISRTNKWYLLLSTLLGCWTAFFLSVLSLFYPVRDVGYRLTHLTASVFLIIGNKHVLDTKLNEIRDSTLVDNLLLLNFIFVAITACLTLIMYSFNYIFYKEGGFVRVLLINSIAISIYIITAICLIINSLNL